MNFTFKLKKSTELLIGSLVIVHHTRESVHTFRPGQFLLETIPPIVRSLQRLKIQAHLKI